MLVKLHHALFALAAVSLCASPAFGAPPADCSKGPIPAGPAKGQFNGTPFVVTSTSMQPLNESQIEANGVKLDTYYITLSQDFPDNTSRSIQISPAAVRGSSLDGKTLRELPADVEFQPGVVPNSGVPEIQGWTLEDDTHNINVDSVGDYKGSMQISFGKRHGNMQPASIYFCTPDARHTWLGGSFSFEIVK